MLARQDSDLTAHVYLWRAADLFRASHKSEKDGKAFSIHLDDLPEPLVRCKKPFDWKRIGCIIFESDRDISVNRAINV